MLIFAFLYLLFRRRAAGQNLNVHHMLDLHDLSAHCQVISHRHRLVTMTKTEPPEDDRDAVSVRG